MKKSSYFLMVSLIVSSCFDREDIRVNDYYSLLAVDEKRNMNLVHDYGEYALSIVPPTVFAVEIYKNYIVVKQHPQQGEYGISKEYTNYYILKANESDFYSAMESRIGPIDLKDFKKEIRRLGLIESERINEIAFNDLE